MHSGLSTYILCTKAKIKPEKSKILESETNIWLHPSRKNLVGGSGFEVHYLNLKILNKETLLRPLLHNVEGGWGSRGSITPLLYMYS